jgi:glycosyltransferase involved in cell wall biosynthesis
LATIPEDAGLISLPLAIWGDGYSSFLPQWWAGVKSLETKPFEIIIVTDEKNFPAVAASFQENLKIEVRDDLRTYAEFWNRAIELCSGKWIAICNVDDYFLPKGLNSIPEAEKQGCNLVCDAIRTKGSDHVQQCLWQPETLNYEFELGGANPMTKALWQASGGFPEGIRFADWGLAIRMRKTGLVKAYTTAEIRIVYDRGYDRLTLSGARLGADQRAEAKEQIRQLEKALR